MLWSFFVGKIYFQAIFVLKNIIFQKENFLRGHKIWSICCKSWLIITLWNVIYAYTWRLSYTVLLVGIFDVTASFLYLAPAESHTNTHADRGLLWKLPEIKNVSCLHLSVERISRAHNKNVCIAWDTLLPGASLKEWIGFMSQISNIYDMIGTFYLFKTQFT